MSDLPVITALLSRPGLGPIHPAQALAELPENQAAAPELEVNEMLSVGLVLGGSRVVWGECAPLTASQLATAGRTLQERVAPVLVGERLDSFRRLAALLDTVTELASMPLPQALPEPEAEPVKLSRRDLFTGRRWSAGRSAGAVSAPQMVTLEQPLQPALRYGLSQALLQAVALVRGVTMADILLEEYQLPRPQAAVPLQVDIGRLNPAVAGRLAYRFASLGYTTTGEEPETELGRQGERLQRFTRRLRERLEELAADSPLEPVIYLDVRGGLGRLYEDNVGRMLGALYGLEQAAGTYPVWVADAVLKESFQEQLELTRQLKEYLRLRRMKLKLVVGIKQVADVETFLATGAAHALYLPLSCLGGLDQAAGAILACRRQDMTVVLGGIPSGMEQATLVACHLALATQPQRLAATLPDAGRFYNEMERILAALGAGT